MAENTIQTRLLLKNDTESNWNMSKFIPKRGEMVIYNADNRYPAPRIKIGDGVTTITNLPFLASVLTSADVSVSTALQALLDEKVDVAGDTMTGELTVPGVTMPDNVAYFVTDQHNKGVIFKRQVGTNFIDQNNSWSFVGMTEDSLIDYAQIEQAIIDGTSIDCGSVNQNGWNGKAQLSSGSTAATVSDATTSNTQIATTAFVQAAIAAALAAHGIT